MVYVKFYAVMDMKPRDYEQHRAWDSGTNSKFLSYVSKYKPAHTETTMVPEASQYQMLGYITEQL